MNNILITVRETKYTLKELFDIIRFREYPFMKLLRYKYEKWTRLTERARRLLR